MVQGAPTGSRNLIARLEALRDCLRAQSEAIVRGNLAAAQRHIEEFAAMAQSLGAIGPLDPETEEARRVSELLRQMEVDHRRLVTNLQRARSDVAGHLQEVQQRQPAVAAYRRQASAGRREALEGAGIGPGLRS